MRRLTPIALILALLCASTPAPALATSTAQEIANGKEFDRQITSQFQVVTDPLENAWVNQIGQSLWTQTARKDVPYNVKILGDSTVNAFSTEGGFIYVDEGLLDFVQSDDELAGVLGHETGHVERRHVVNLTNKASILNILFGVASIFSPWVYRFGQVAEAGIVAKMQRDDEYQADSYGLLLMSRAGYDPDSMVSFMRHLNATHTGHDSIVDKYFADHPGTPDRIKRLLSLPQLDPKTRTNDQLLVQAEHDQEEARYSIAALKYNQVLKTEPDNATALLHLGETELALGQPVKGTQMLAAAADKGTPEIHTLALSTVTALQSQQRAFNLNRPDVGPLKEAVTQGQRYDSQQSAALAARRDAARAQLKSISGRLQALAAEAPAINGGFNPNTPAGGRIDAVSKALGQISRGINVSIEKASEIAGGVGSLQAGKEGGILKGNRDIYNELLAPLNLDQIPPQALSTLQYYPQMISELKATDDDGVKAIDAARGSLALLDGAITATDRFVRNIDSDIYFTGTISAYGAKNTAGEMQAAIDAVNKAAAAATQAWSYYNMARARQVETRITLLGLSYPQVRYDSLRYAVDKRFSGSALDFDALAKDDLSPGEMAAAAVAGAAANATTEAIVAQAKAERTSVIDVAQERNVRTLGLELFLGLIYLDYADDPAREAIPGASGTINANFQ